MIIAAKSIAKRIGIEVIVNGAVSANRVITNANANGITVKLNTRININATIARGIIARPTGKINGKALNLYIILVKVLKPLLDYFVAGIIWIRWSFFNGYSYKFLV